MRYVFEKSAGYYVGFDKPVLAPAAVIRSGAEAEGFQVAQMGPCDGVQLPFPTPDPCGESWDWVAFVRRLGETKGYDLPDRIKWIVDTTAPGPAVPLQTAGPATGSKFWITATLTVVAAGGILTAIVVGRRKRR